MVRLARKCSCTGSIRRKITSVPTPAEQKALLFLGAVALVGGAVRLFGGDAPAPEPTPHERAGLTAQIAATETATAAARAERAGKRSG